MSNDIYRGLPIRQEVTVKPKAVQPPSSQTLQVRRSGIVSSLGIRANAFLARAPLEFIQASAAIVSRFI